MIYPNCPICDNGKLTQILEKNNNLHLLFSICDYCNSEQSNYEEVKINKHLKSIQ